MDSYRAFNAWFHIAYVECAYHFVGIDMDKWYPIMLPSMSKTSFFKTFCNASINSFIKPRWILEA